MNKKIQVNFLFSSVIRMGRVNCFWLNFISMSSSLEVHVLLVLFKIYSNGFFFFSFACSEIIRASLDLETRPKDVLEKF